MENSLTFDKFSLTTDKTVFKITNYNTICLNKIREYLNKLDNSYFKYIKLQDNSKIEKVCLDYYGSTDFYDLTLLLNSREAIFDMAYSYDIIFSAVEKDLEEYRNKVFKDSYKDFSETTRNKLFKYLENKYDTNNEANRYLKVISANYVYNILSYINIIIEEYQGNIALLDL